MTIEQSSVHWKRLTQGRAFPGWLLVIWKFAGNLSTLSFVRGSFGPAWTFLTSPAGNLLVTLAGFAWLAAVLLWPRHSQVADVEIPPAETIPIPSSPEITWADRMEQDDAAKINQRVVPISWEPEPHFSANDPYIDFKVTFVNGTVFHLMSEKIEGPTHYGKDPLAQHPSIIEPPFILPHGERRWTMIRQHVSKDVAQSLSTARGIVKLDFSRVHITFVVDGHTNAAPQKFLWFGGDVTVAIRD
jgi:hypothetical protein